MATRKFSTVYESLLKVLPPQLGDQLEKSAPYWAPEVGWYKLSSFINQNVIPSSKDPRSVQIYATLIGVSEEEMKKRFIANGD